MTEQKGFVVGDIIQLKDCASLRKYLSDNFDNQSVRWVRYAKGCDNVDDFIAKMLRISYQVRSVDKRKTNLTYVAVTYRDRGRAYLGENSALILYLRPEEIIHVR